MTRGLLLALVFATAGCRREASASPAADTGPGDVGWQGSPAAPPGAELTAWSQLAPILEPCIEPERGLMDTSVYVRVVGGVAHILNVSCVDGDVDAECVQRGIESARFAPSMSKEDERLLITRRTTGPAAHSEHVRVRTPTEIFRANRQGGAFDAIFVGPSCW